MKRILTILVAGLFTVSLCAQDLEKIINKHADAINAEKLAGFKSVKVSGTLTQQGMQLKMVMYEKAPDKIKAVSIFNDVEIVQVINGDKGFMVNPLMGSSEPAPLTPKQISSVKDNSLLSSSILNDYKAGRVRLEGEENIDGKEAYKLKVSSDDGDRYVFIDKETFYITQVNMSANSMGMDVEVQMKMSDFKETDGVVMARTMNTFMNGQPAGSVVYDNIEFNSNIEDSVFEIK